MTETDKKEKTENALSKAVDNDEKSEKNPMDCIEFPEGTPRRFGEPLRYLTPKK